MFLYIYITLQFNLFSFLMLQFYFVYLIYTIYMMKTLVVTIIYKLLFTMSRCGFPCNAGLNLTSFHCSVLVRHIFTNATQFFFYFIYKISIITLLYVYVFIYLYCKSRQFLSKEAHFKEIILLRSFQQVDR